MRHIISFCLLVFILPQSPKLQSAFIEPSLIDAFEQQAQVEYIVWLKDRHIFKKPISSLSKNQKATMVYDQLVSKAKTTQNDIKAFLESKKLPYQSFYITNAIKVKSGISDMIYISTFSEVDRIFYNQPIRLLQYEEDKTPAASRSAEPEWGIKMIQADSVWAMGNRGEGVVVGGHDTGYAWEVSPIKKQYKGYIDTSNVNHNFHWHDAIHERNPNYPDSLMNPCGFNSLVPCDDNNHGTHTMGTMVGEDTENQIGVAPASRWIGCRNMDRGWGTPATYLECFEWFLAPYDLNGENADPSLAPHVINNSWYCSEPEGCNLSNFYLMEEVVDNLKASGIVVVVSTGNSGPDCGTVTGPPAIFENSFSIGATNDVDTIARFSSRGVVVIDSSFRVKPNVSAPGARVRSVIRNGNFANFSGTSMAGPHVAGLVALMISANPDLAGKVEEIEDMIEATADKKTFDQDCNNVSGQSIPNAVYGFGRVNAFQAVKRAMAFNTRAVQVERKKGLSIFPNPAEDLVQFVLEPSFGKIVNLTLYNISGQKVFQESEMNMVAKSLDVRHLPKGMYVYEVIDNTGFSYMGKLSKI